MTLSTVYSWFCSLFALGYSVAVEYSHVLRPGRRALAHTFRSRWCVRDGRSPATAAINRVAGITAVGVAINAT
jgi:hypothetical protein